MTCVWNERGDTVSDVLGACSCVGCERQSCERWAPQNELFSPCEVHIIAARISMCRHRTWHKPETRVLCADAFNEHAWPRSGDGDADRR